MIASIEYALELEDLLDDLLVAHGVDFTRYERACVARRVHARMLHLDVDTLTCYRARLAADAAELARLHDGLLVHVTSFFRDPDAWGHLAGAAVPRILHATLDRPQLRVWSAGCASGEEALSLAMLLAEALGPGEYARRVKIYATDRDEGVVARARRAAFSAAQLRAVPERLARKYFTRDAHGFVPASVIRRSITFGRHDLVRDVPISRLQLIVCRNTLMYLDPPTQAKILERFSSSLETGGVLFLGGAEMPSLAHPRLFEPLSLQHHVFTKAAATTDVANGRARSCTLARPT